MSKTMIAPVIAVACMAVQLLFGVKISEELQSQVADAIVNIVLVATAIYGVFKNHTK